MARKIFRELTDADAELLKTEIETAAREWTLLEVLQEDLLNPRFALEFYRERDTLERLIDA